MRSLTSVGRRPAVLEACEKHWRGENCGCWGVWNYSWICFLLYSILPVCVCVYVRVCNTTNWWSLCLIRDMVSMLQRLEDPHIIPGLMLNPYSLRRSLMYSLLMFLKKWVCCQYKVQTGGCICLQWHNIKKVIEELQSWFHTNSHKINKKGNVSKLKIEWSMLHCKIFKRNNVLAAIRSIYVANCPAHLACSLLSGRMCFMLIVVGLSFWVMPGIAQLV